MRLIFPTDQDMGYLSKRSGHFGKADYYTIITLKDNAIDDVEVVQNAGHDSGSCGSAIKNIMALNPEALIVKGIGASPAKGFVNNGVTIYSDLESDTVEESVKAFVEGRLEQISAGTCSHH
jgi:predicted Fe-Mo cluster-binding NifX family protein